jgi:RHS repeat-associated protein
VHHTIATEGIQKAYFHYDKMGKYGICERPRRKPAGVHRVDEWGNVQNQKQLDMNFSGLDRTVNYTGHDYDEVLEKYFAQARLYDPSTRRFLSPDPLGQGGNLYIYCKDNPLAFTDPGGLSPVKIREYVNKYSYQYYTNVGWNTSSRTSTFTIGSKTLSSTANGSNGAGINIWNQNDYLMAQDYELDRYFFYVASTPSSNTTPTISPSPPASPQVAQNTNNQNLYTPSYTDIIAIAGAGGYFSSPGCTIGNDYTYAMNNLMGSSDPARLVAVGIYDFAKEQLEYSWTTKGDKYTVTINGKTLTYDSSGKNNHGMNIWVENGKLMAEYYDLAYYFKINGWVEYFPGFEWDVNGSLDGQLFRVNTHQYFLFKPFGKDFAGEIINMRGSNGLYEGMSVTDLAAEFYAHAVMLVYTELIKGLWDRAASWNESAKAIDIAPNDPRADRFNAIWNLIGENTGNPLANMKVFK